MLGLYMVRPDYGTLIYERLCQAPFIFPSNVSDVCANNSQIQSFLSVARKYNTDKVTTHHYEGMYEKYLRKYVGTNVYLLEIGLGCGMVYGPGASAHLWRHYLGPLANIYFLEFDRPCGEQWYKSQGYKVNNFFIIRYTPELLNR